MTESSRERRQSVRAPIKIEVVCEEVQKTVPGEASSLHFFSSDISIGGVFLQTRAPFSQGDTLHLQFDIPGVAPDVRVTGKVVRVMQEGQGAMPGIGIEFINIDAKDKKKIEQYVVHAIAGQL